MAAAFPPPFPYSVSGIKADREAELTLLCMRLCRYITQA